METNNSQHNLQEQDSNKQAIVTVSNEASNNQAITQSKKTRFLRLLLTSFVISVANIVIDYLLFFIISLIINVDEWGFAGIFIVIPIVVTVFFIFVLFSSLYLYKKNESRIVNFILLVFLTIIFLFIHVNAIEYYMGSRDIIWIIYYLSTFLLFSWGISVNYKIFFKAYYNTDLNTPEDSKRLGNVKEKLTLIFYFILLILIIYSVFELYKDYRFHAQREEKMQLTRNLLNEEKAEKKKNNDSLNEMNNEGDQSLEEESQDSLDLEQEFKVLDTSDPDFDKYYNSDCNDLSLNPYESIDCFMEMAIDIMDYKPCKYTGNPLSSKDCAKGAAKIINDISYCEDFYEEESAKEYCYYNASKIITKDNLCDDVVGNNYRDECFLGLAEVKKDIKICDKITEEREKNNCLSSLSVENGDFSSCDIISDLKDRDSCYFEIIINNTAKECFDKAGDDKMLEGQCQLEGMMSFVNKEECEKLTTSVKERCLETADTNQKSVDTDGDGLSDDDEKNIYKTDINNPDTDGDGFLDGDEIKNGYDPLQ